MHIFSLVHLSQFLRLCVVVLFTVFGANTAFAVPTATSDISYFQTETTHFIQTDDVCFAARAPPMAVSNVAVTGGVTVMRGSAFAVHGQETVAALFGFDADHNATNRGDTKSALEIGNVDTYGNSKKTTGDGTIHRDHQPSKQALIDRAEELKGEPLTPAEIKRITNNSTIVTVPADVHKAGPTYGGKIV